MLYHHSTGTGRDLVLLHGWGMHSGIWQSFLPYLARHFRVTCIDLPGHGHSQFAAHLSMDLDATLSAIMQVAPARAYWCGWSLGGMLLHKLAHDYPQRILKTGYIASTPCFVAGPNWAGISPDLLATFLSNLQNQYEKTLNDFITLQCLGLPEARMIKRQITSQLAVCALPDPSALSHAFDWLVNLDHRSLVRNSKQPALYLWGRLDKLAPAKLATLLPMLKTDVACHVLPKAGHVPFITEPDLCAQIITEFMQCNH